MTHDDSPKLHNIAVLPGAHVSPEVVLNRTLQKLPRIKAVAIVIQWDDDSMACDWSSMRTSALCMAKEVFGNNVTFTCLGKGDTLEPMPDDPMGL